MSIRRRRRPVEGQLLLFAEAQPAEPVPDPEPVEAPPDAEPPAEMPRPPAKIVGSDGRPHHDPRALARWQRDIRRWIITHAPIRPALRRVLLYLDGLAPAQRLPDDAAETLGRLAGKRLVSWASLGAITRGLGLRPASRRRVERWLGELERLGDPDRDVILHARARRRSDGSCASCYRWIGYGELARTIRRGLPARRPRTGPVPPARYAAREHHRPVSASGPVPPPASRPVPPGLWAGTPRPRGRASTPI